MTPMFQTILIANRGAIACRIIRTCRKLGIRTVAVFSDADAGSLHVAEADEAVRIGPALATQSYLDGDAVLDVARRTGAGAIHPGYGFLSENAEFAERCEAAGIAFIGPAPETMRTFGLKHAARAFAAEQGVRLAPGTELLTDVACAVKAAGEIGYPVMLKATAGGGGIGMRVCEDEADVSAAFDAVARLGAGNFGDAGVFLERYVRNARHVEVQVFGDGQGRIATLGERDCSLQRRNQKVIEETPAPLLPERVRQALRDSARRLMSAAKYRSAGTVEFLYDPEHEDFYFLEVNTRLQVEHGVTEQVTGIDLVEWMIRGAAGDFTFLDAAEPEPTGVSIQARLYAEDPGQEFRPSSGLLTEVVFPGNARVESWVARGSEVSAFYDPMLAKLIVTAPDRTQAIEALQAALDATRIEGIETNLHWLRQVARDARFVAGEVSTRLLDRFAYCSGGIRVLSGGPASTIQDWPGRLGYWSIGVPPSGPMDSLSFRLANRLLGNAEAAAALEFTGVGPTLSFETDALVCLGGAECRATLDGEAVGNWRPFTVRAGQVLKIGRISGAGLRGYLAVRGGWQASPYLGSRATFTLGGFGGHAGRGLTAGDLLRIGDAIAGEAEASLPEHARPQLTHEWQIRVLYGPHGAPDFFTPEDIETLLEAKWVVHHNSSRTGVRLIGPKPHWARTDGGEAGLHPSNIHDNAYAVGAVDFTGDMPILLGPDGPSLGGFVCPFVVILADLWMIGQLAPGDTIRFVPVCEELAGAVAEAQSRAIAEFAAPPVLSAGTPESSPIIHAIEAQRDRPQTLYRRQGDANLLVEYGPIMLDIELRLRVHALMQELESLGLDGIIDLTPGVRSLQLHYDPRRLPQSQLIDLLVDAETKLGGLDDFEIASRVVHMPLSWDDPAIHETITKYMASVREDAPWTPDNIEFIRRINGLDSIEDVLNTVFEARYLVLGLGDVYLGAPLATPLDPRHRLVTTKYNPARTWTPPNVVGIGGAYLCIYGMEGPGGYQLFGRTIQVWNSWRQTADFADGKPWLLRFFDQIRFFPVSHDELEEWRRDFPLGRRELRVEYETFRVADYRKFQRDNAASIAAFQQRRDTAFQVEWEAWNTRGEFDRVAELTQDNSGPVAEAIVVPPDCEAVEAPLSGSVWKMRIATGDVVNTDTVIAIVEAMKMEHHVTAGISGTVRDVYVKESQAVVAGAPLVAIETQS